MVLQQKSYLSPAKTFEKNLDRVILSVSLAGKLAGRSLKTNIMLDLSARRAAGRT